MSVLVSKSGRLVSDRKFSKELFTEVAQNLRVITDEEWESYKEVSDREALEHKKILIAVYLRTNVDNLVLIVDKDKFSSIFDVPSFIVDSGLYPHLLIDSGLICAKEFIENAFLFKDEGATKRLAVNSACYPVGAVETSKKYILVYNIVISTDILRDRNITLKKGFEFRPIETLHLTDLLQKEISESLVIVKSEGKKK